MLSSPYVPNPFNAASFFAKEKEVGERGLTMFGLPHAMYALQQFTGSENFAIWSIECREELLEVVGEYGRRILEHIKLALAAGIRGVYGWVGPEVCIPPLMSPRDFDDFILPFDKAICDLIHEGGGYNWVHCHGGMQPVIERFVEMGADVLNPVEPPPMGDVTLEEAFDMVGNRMGIEGNIENHEFWVSSPERVAEIVREALEAGRGRRLILCSCSGYMEDPEPPARFIENLLVYINEGLHHAERMAKG